MGPNPMQNGIAQAGQTGVGLTSTPPPQAPVQAPTSPAVQPAVLTAIQNSPEYQAFVDALNGKKRQ